MSRVMIPLGPQGVADVLIRKLLFVATIMFAVWDEVMLY